jgi:hypothetical protein
MVESKGFCPGCIYSGKALSLMEIQKRMQSTKQDFGRVHTVLTRACSELNLNFSPSELTSMARLIAGTMGGKARFFHNPDHVIHVGSHGDAISVLAALFHDLVYLQIDEGMGGEVASLIARAVDDGPEGRRVKLELEPEARLACDLFDVDRGAKISKMHGQNEFLSGLVAAYLLHRAAGPARVAEILCCIELTIPFRGRDKLGNFPADLLLERLHRLDAELSLNLGESGCRFAIRRAVRLANQDVSSFGASQGADFLAHTWELVPETNPMLRAPKAASAQAFAQALLQMEGFFSNLAPKLVFQQFDGEPSNHDFDSMQRNAARNIEEGRYYFRLKIICLAVMEAMGETLGKNTGLPVLLGELSNLAVPRHKVEKFIPRIQSAVMEEASGLARRVLQLLQNPPHAETGPTLKSSPMAAFMLLEMGFEEMLQLWEPSVQFLQDKIGPGELLMRVPSGAYKHFLMAVEAAVKHPAKKRTKKAS